MMRDSSTPALADDRRMPDAFGVAYIHDVPDDVVRVFLERIIGRTIEVAPRSVVIDAEPAAHIEIPKFVPKFGQLCVISCAFAHCALDRRNIGHLRSVVEMNQFKAMRQTGIL